MALEQQKAASALVALESPAPIWPAALQARSPYLQEGYLQALNLQGLESQG